MKISRILIAFVLTVLMLGYARMSNVSRSVRLLEDKDGIKIEHNTVAKHIGHGIPVVKARIEGAMKARLFYRNSSDDDFEWVPMLKFPDDADLYSASLPALPKGWEVFYYIEAVGGEGNAKIVTLPDRDSADFKPVTLRYLGRVPAVILIFHVIAVFAAVFFACASLFSALDVRKGRTEVAKAVKYPVMTVIAMALGYFVLGFPMNIYSYGPMWEGIPFGTDVTDNKSQVIFLFWLAVLVLFKGSVMRKGEDKNLARPSAYFTIILVAFLVMLIVYAIPHSL